MPPKRKAAATSSADSKTGSPPPKAAKPTPKKTPAAKAPAKPKAPTKAALAKAAAAEEASLQYYDAGRCAKWFGTFTGLEEDDLGSELIGPAGISKLCEDIGVSLEAIDMLVLAYHLKADTMPIFTKDEWIKGMKSLEVDSTIKLKAVMPRLVAKLKNPQDFKEFYRYIFMFVKSSEQKCMDIETACSMLETVMAGRPHVKSFVAFLQTKKPVKVINKDQWYNLLDFSDTVSEDLSNYDGINSAWPVLLDEYVEWRNESS
ncbi:DCN1-like protein 5 [Gryganskiella cystojenkinii]|nr:DCN1-like protein 5 [Gryganskiella cystojenkinii]